MDADSFNANGLAWAVSRWNAEVSQRPLVNVHRRSLDDTWRQVIRHFGGDPDKLLGLSHDVLLAAGKDGANGMEPLGWEWRFFDTAHEPPGWGEWKRLTPHSRIQTADQALTEMRNFIRDGYRYQLRPIYAGPVEGFNAAGVMGTDGEQR